MLVLAALRVRDFRLLWGAGLVSSAGSWLLVLAVPAHVFMVTGSLAASGLTQAAEYLPLLVLGPVAGVFADRCDRRRLMIGADLLRAGAVALMLLGASAQRSWVLYLALVAEAGGTVIFTPALQARTPEIVGTGKLLTSANSLTAAGRGVVRLLGGPLGGVLLALAGFRALVCGDAASYLLSALALAMTSRQPGTGQARRPAGAGVDRPRMAAVRDVRRELAEGVRAVRGHRAPRALFLVTVVFLAANAALSAVVVPFGVSRLGGSRNTGLLFAALGIGFLLGTPAVRVLMERIPPRRLLTVTLSATAAASYLLFRSPSLVPALAAAVAVGMFGSMTLVAAQTALQRAVPGPVLGRVSAAFLAGEAGVTLLGAVAGPVLAQIAGFTGLAAVSCAAMSAAAVLAHLLLPRGVSGSADVAVAETYQACPGERQRHHGQPGQRRGCERDAGQLRHVDERGDVHRPVAEPQERPDLADDEEHPQHRPGGHRQPRQQPEQRRRQAGQHPDGRQLRQRRAQQPR